MSFAVRPHISQAHRSMRPGRGKPWSRLQRGQMQRNALVCADSAADQRGGAIISSQEQQRPGPLMQRRRCSKHCGHFIQVVATVTFEPLRFHVKPERGLHRATTYIVRLLCGSWSTACPHRSCACRTNGNVDPCSGRSFEAQPRPDFHDSTTRLSRASKFAIGRPLAAPVYG